MVLSFKKANSPSLAGKTARKYLRKIELFYKKVDAHRKPQFTPADILKRVEEYNIDDETAKEYAPELYAFYSQAKKKPEEKPEKKSEEKSEDFNDKAETGDIVEKTSKKKSKKKKKKKKSE